jgi:nitrogen regulatory protein PII-like uncharacterized protein
VISIQNYQTLGRKANFCKSLVVWYLEAKNLVVELKMLITAAASNRNQDKTEKLSKKSNDAPWTIMSTPITTVRVTYT